MKKEANATSLQRRAPREERRFAMQLKRGPRPPRALPAAPSRPAWAVRRAAPSGGSDAPGFGTRACRTAPGAGALPSNSNCMVLETGAPQAEAPVPGSAAGMCATSDRTCGPIHCRIRVSDTGVPTGFRTWRARPPSPRHSPVAASLAITSSRSLSKIARSRGLATPSGIVFPRARRSAKSSSASFRWRRASAISPAPK